MTLPSVSWEILWISVLCLSLIGIALMLWIARDAIEDARRASKPYRWGDAQRRGPRDIDLSSLLIWGAVVAYVALILFA